MFEARGVSILSHFADSTLPQSGLLGENVKSPWSSKGHEIVAAIAETHLTDTALKCIKELLPQGTALADASTWPDNAGRQIRDMGPYHFINFPKYANAYANDCEDASLSAN